MPDNSRPLGSTPYLRQLLLQCSAAFAVLGVVWPYHLFRQQPLPWFESSLLIGAAAFLLASLTRQPWWWRAIHGVFAPAAALVSGLNMPPYLYLAAFALMLLVYRGALSTQVPLYLSGQPAAQALLHLLAEHPPTKAIDLGAGVGTITCTLAKGLRHTHVAGVENSLIPWLIGRLRTARLPNCQWSLGDLWRFDLTEYDVAYAFLSPAPMKQLWEKVKREMGPGTLFVSNSFPVPDIEPTFVIDVPEGGDTHLYCYRL